MKTQTTIPIVLIILGLSLLVLKLLSASKLPPLKNFEEAEYSDHQPFLEPISIEDGLAVYVIGSGPPVLLFPYPHAHTTEPMAQGPIADALVEMGRTVITFDVPGAYSSTRQPTGDIEEMLISAQEALDRLDINQPIDVIGHSMSGLAALGFAVEHPERTNRLILIGSMSGFPAVLKHGLPKSAWKPSTLEYWKFIFLGLKVKSGFGNLADHKNLQNIMSRESFHDKSRFTPVDIYPDDRAQGTPIREVVWGGNLFHQLDYADQLGTVQANTLILVGRYDAEAPLPCSQELRDGIPAANMVIFEASGHYPFLEEPGQFNETIKNFLDPEQADDNYVPIDAVSKD